VPAPLELAGFLMGFEDLRKVKEKLEFVDGFA
jgi:hypothetical protein